MGFPISEWATVQDPPASAMDEVHVWRAPADGEGRALREVLARYLDEEPARIALRMETHGKPALADPASSLCFNLSHSSNLALIAVTRGREIGVDIERIRPRRNLKGLVDRALDPSAADAVRAAPPLERLAAFHQAWTRREAIAKCLGTGLGVPLPSAPVAVTALDAGPRYAAAIAVAGDKAPSPRLFRLQSVPASRT